MGNRGDSTSVVGAAMVEQGTSAGEQGSCNRGASSVALPCVCASTVVIAAAAIVTSIALNRIGRTLAVVARIVGDNVVACIASPPLL